MYDDTRQLIAVMWCDDTKPLIGVMWCDDQIRFARSRPSFHWSEYCGNFVAQSHTCYISYFHILIQAYFLITIKQSCYFVERRACGCHEQVHLRQSGYEEGGFSLFIFNSSSSNILISSLYYILLCV